ncbi:cyclin-domain-containing protein [Kalaharituber pfeilii]|nr:cyclin-domain-containing protein [Kalaharituber pfeilii]
MTAGNQQDSVYRPPSHIPTSSASSSEPRSQGASAVPSSIQPAPSASTHHRGSVSSTSGRHAVSHTSSHQNSTIPKQPSHRNTPPPNDYKQYPHYPADAAASSSSSSSLQGSDSRPISPPRSRRSSQDSPPPSQPQPIRLRDLSHIVELAQDEARQQARSPLRRTRREEARKRYEISSVPVPDVIEMVARLLTKITTTNDQTHHDMQKSISGQEGPSSLGGTTSSILAFHGKNVPSITIQSYLSRIHKYCPTSYEVFLSLLVYFDRMTEKVNQNATDWKAGRRNSTAVAPSSQQPSSPTPGSSAGDTITGVSVSDQYNSMSSMSHVFVVDSFNIHRLVIAGVTCASKFFSDIFYTNSRYAKVGGLPLAELNHLELQFLILNDFRLAVPVEELEAYGTMLVSFYAREAMANANLQGGIAPPLQPGAIEQTRANERRREATGPAPGDPRH